VVAILLVAKSDALLRQSVLAFGVSSPAGCFRFCPAPRPHGFQSLSVPRCSAVCCAAPSAPPPRVVVVDPRDDMRDALQRYLSEQGFRCDAVGSANEALQAMSQTLLPDALISEVTMDGPMDGLGLLRAVRSDARLCHMPVVLLTARGLSPDRIAAFRAGASAFISKPYDPQELVEVLRSLMTNALLARGAGMESEMRALREEVASLRQLLQAVLMQRPRAPLQLDEQRPMVLRPPDPPLQLPSGAAQAQYGQPGRPGIDPPRLTPRERSVLELVGEGMLNKEISNDLGVSLR
jgi:DNA-binding NarL/FixJ family response regulator